MHSRVSLHQVAFARESTAAFLAHCRAIGVPHVSLVTSLLPRAAGQLAVDGVDVATLNHPFGRDPDLQHDRGTAAQGLVDAVGTAVEMNAAAIYLLTGGRGSLTWEQAAQRFAELISDGRAAAADAGISLMVENASPFNADIHIAHTLADTIALAEIAGVGVCIDLHGCWPEAGLAELFRRAAPVTGLVQVSDYVLGDRTAPCRAVPGDGGIPLDRLVGDLLDAGYRGLFDIELVGPRIEAEGAGPATERAAQQVSDMLARLGA